MKKYLPFFLIVLFVSPACSENLSVSISYPKPLTVQISGPENLVQRSKGFMQGIPYAGCGYKIEWGDESKSPEVGFSAPYCSDTLTHTYKQAGQYKIEVTTYDQGETDGAENIRNGSVIADVR